MSAAVDLWAERAYAPAGHTAIVDEDVKSVDFSPTRELNEVMANVGRNMAGMNE